MSVQYHFARGQQFFLQKQYPEAFEQFQQCANLMPHLIEAWENMAVCMANQGFPQSSIEETLLPLIDPSLRAQLQAKIDSLVIVSRHQHRYMSKLQDLDLPGAVSAFVNLDKEQPVSDDEAVTFLHALFVAHESLAKKQGRVRIDSLLQEWSQNPAIQRCMAILSTKTDALIQASQTDTAIRPEDLMLLETLSIIHYTYANYEHAAICFQYLHLLTPDPAKKVEYQQHLSTCYSLEGEYEKALSVDPNNLTAWERFDPTSPAAFRAQTVKIHRSAQNIGRTCVAYWPTGNIVFQNEEITVAKLHDICIAGHDPMIFDADFVYSGNRRLYRHVDVQDKKPVPHRDGMVVLATNPNNHYHQITEFCAKILASHHFYPQSLSIFVMTEQPERYRQLFALLGLSCPVQTFSVQEILSFQTLYVVDVTTPGHTLPTPANLWDVYLPHAQSIVRLRERLLTHLSRDKPAKPLFVYVERKGARSFDDPHERLLSFLQKWTRERGFGFVLFTGQGSYTEQLQVFAQASIVFGIHGAGLTNLIVAPPDGVIVEIPIHHNSNPLFQELSAVCGHRHHICSISCEYQGQISVNDDLLSLLASDLEQAWQNAAPLR